MKSLYSCLSLLFLTALTLTNANGQDTDTVLVFESKVTDVLKMKAAETEEIKVESATKTAQNIYEAPNLVNVFGRNEINEYGFYSLNQILWRQANFFAGQDYDRPTVGMRGIFEGWNNNHYLLMVDGLPFNEIFYGAAMTWEVTPLFFSRNIEVMRGAGSALYGTNAMNGVINLQTVAPSDLKNKFEFRARGGNNGVRIFDLLAAAENNKFNIVFGYNSYAHSGNSYETYDNSGRKDEEGNLKKFFTKDRRSNDYFFTKVSFKGKLEGLVLQNHLQRTNYETGLGWLFVVPDRSEDLNERRNMVSLSYKTPSVTKKFKQEYSAVYQKKYINWNLRMVPDSTYSYGLFYPLGITEIIYTSAQSLFLRAQYSYTTDKNGTFLAGIESDAFFYNGDKVHMSNVDLTNTFETHPENQLLPLNGILEYGQGRPKINTGIFFQYISPKIADKLSLTVGGRLDYQTLSYNRIYSPEREVVRESFRQFNPRISLVYQALPNFYAKLIAGRAFRAPAPTEIFGANTVTLASNVEELRPETMDNIEFSTNWNLQNKLFIRASAFYTDFRDIIAYSMQNYSLSTNIYSLRNAGFELEADWKGKIFSGFANLGYTKRLRENITDTTIFESSRLAWAPAVTVKAGLIFRKNKFFASCIGHYQGKVFRRESDFFSILGTDGKEIETRPYRPEYLPAWTRFDIKAGYTVSKNLELGLFVANLFNSESYLIKINSSPMDYRMPMRQILIDVKFSY